MDWITNIFAAAACHGSTRSPACIDQASLKAHPPLQQRRCLLYHTKMHTHRRCKHIHLQSLQSSYISKRIAESLIKQETTGLEKKNGSRAATRSAIQATSNNSNGVCPALSQCADVQCGRINHKLSWFKERRLRSFRLHCQWG
jgi:hypothetical protein